ncbi:hypothetical protein EJ04DRAFT_139635 [Polyplosphaeria fusca]|uniref:Uncharacterized protein n=1 Tax=Polyplosphaeria fusca TaxID=682080 RepID=A0A9P4UT26_9PLEO|nr:hypothetical protein EJ04DRAFT_139635 [Polyplosphaeria fusca]
MKDQIHVTARINSHGRNISILPLIQIIGVVAIEIQFMVTVREDGIETLRIYLWLKIV